MSAFTSLERKLDGIDLAYLAHGGTVFCNCCSQAAVLAEPIGRLRRDWVLADLASSGCPGVRPPS